MSLFLVRHAKAGKRKEWDGDDVLRPLDKIGRLQAEALALRLSGKSPTDLFSSRYVRCIETLEPLAEHLGHSVTVDDHLTEGADRGALVLELCKCAAVEAVGAADKGNFFALIDVLEDTLHPVTQASVRHSQQNQLAALEVGTGITGDTAFDQVYNAACIA
jgi:hypothetical protein